MASEELKVDQNNKPVAGAITDDSNQYIKMLRIDDTTKGLKVSLVGGVGAGTVTSISQGTGILLSANPITTTGSVSLATSLQPMATLTGNALKFLRVNAGETALEYATVSAGLTIGSTAITSGTTTRILYDNAGVLGEYTISGSGTVVAMATSPIFTTSITTPSVLATANDSGAIGASGTAFSDLFLASGAVINFNAGNMTLTHAAGSLTFAGGNVLALGATTATTFNGLAITANGTNTLNITAGKTLTVSNSLTLAGTDSTTMTFPSTNATIARTDAGQTFTGTQVLAENASIQLDPAGSADGKFTGITVTGTGGATIAFGDLVYLDSATSRWKLTDADSATTSDRMIAMAVSTSTDGNPVTLLLQGIIRADSKFPALTIGSAVYVGETAGEIQVAIPTGADNVIRRVGYALTADEIYFNPSMDSQITVA